MQEVAVNYLRNMYGNSLRKNSEFRVVYKEGQVYWSRFLVLRCLKKTDYGKTRIGIAPSRKIKKAVERNKLKRRVREIFRQYQYLIKDGIDLVINIKADAITASFYILKKDFEHLLKKSRLI